MKKVLIKIVVVVALVIAMFVGTSCASCDRMMKSCQSDIAGGMNRRVIVYDYQGNVLATYEGLIDLSTEADNCVLFHIDGKRIVWYNAIVSIEEL